MESLNYLFYKYPERKINKVEMRRINPKAMQNKYLYGFINNMTNEWFDGIISKTVKQVVKEKQGTFT